jgi:hypothetical protein
VDSADPAAVLGASEAASEADSAAPVAVSEADLAVDSVIPVVDSDADSATSEADSAGLVGLTAALQAGLVDRAADTESLRPPSGEDSAALLRSEDLVARRAGRSDAAGTRRSGAKTGAATGASALEKV